ncbi:MAG: ECF-type sigma factor [Phycisphaerales bacterium JB059]
MGVDDRQLPLDEVTTFLLTGGGDSRVTQVFERSYEELRRLAAGMMESERLQHTLQPTALVHEIWLRLRHHLEDVHDDRHFFALAARAMRHVLADHARMHKAKKRGAGAPMVTLSEGMVHASITDLNLVELHDCLEQLNEEHTRAARVFELRAFGALPLPKIAELLGVAEITARRDWDFARLWLQRSFMER